MNWYDSLQSVLTPFLIGLIMSAGIGLIIGLEREFNTHGAPNHIGGIRTFILVALLGYTAAWLSQKNQPVVLYLMGTAFVVLIGMSYYIQAIKGQLGLASEIALLLTFTLGVTISMGFIRESLAIVVLMTTVLSLKEQLHGFIRQITEVELFAFIKFIVLALLILPMLPNEPFGPNNLLNLYDIGWIVVLVLSFSFSGYLLLKFGSPNKGILLTSIIGGLFSSTMIAWVFSARSRERKDLAPALGAGIVLASSIMFIRVMVLTFLFAPGVAMRLLFPFSVLFLLSLTPLWELRKKRQNQEMEQLSPGNPLDIKNALLFVILYIGVTLLMYSSRQWLGPTMTYLSGAAAGIADMDAITISTAKWAMNQTAYEQQAALIILLAASSNSIFKLLVSVLNGAPEIRRPVLLGFGLVLVAASIFLLVWLAGG